MADEQCAFCHQTFWGNSRPRWAFTLDGLPAGRVHATCATRQRDPFYRGYAGQGFDEAHFLVWTRYVRDWTEDAGLVWSLQVLIGEPVETLTDSQRSMIDWWREHKEYDSERIQAIEVGHTALVREFLSWRANLGREGS